MNAEVVVVGEAMALMLASSGLPLKRAIRFERGVAGAESNVAIGLARLGHRVAFAGRVGDDAAGDWVRNGLRGEGIDTSSLTTEATRPTGLMLRDWAGESRPIVVDYYRHGSAGSTIDPEQLPREAIRQARAVFVSGITAMLSPSAEAYVDAFFDAAADAGVPVYLDPNIRLRLAPIEDWQRVIRPLIKRASTLLVGHDELQLLELDPDGACHLNETTSTVVIKSGSAGAHVVSRDGQFTQPARTVRVVDTVGAGDAFTAGWISARLRGMDIRRTARAASIVASLAVAAPGDTAGLPTRTELDTIAENGSEVDR